MTKQAVAVATANGEGQYLFDPCYQFGWYEDGVCDWFCVERDSDCDIPDLFAEDLVGGKATVYPIVLAHGLDSRGDRWVEHGHVKALRADGHEVYVTNVPPHDSVEARGSELARQLGEIIDHSGAERVNIIAHSMGGLDSRHAISSLGLGEKVASLTTIGTPHRGSYVADVALSAAPQVADQALDTLASMWAGNSSKSDLRAAVSSLTEAHAPVFNAANPDVEGVFYQSWAGVSTVSGMQNNADRRACEGLLREDPAGSADRVRALFLITTPIVARGLEMRSSDGLVEVASTQWGWFNGCVPADHIDIVGDGIDGANPNTGFDDISFVRQIAFDLSFMGF